MTAQGVEGALGKGQVTSGLLKSWKSSVPPAVDSAMLWPWAQQAPAPPRGRCGGGTATACPDPQVLAPTSQKPLQQLP